MEEKDKPSRFRRLELQGQAVPSQDDPGAAGEGRFCPNCGALLQNYQQVCATCHKTLSAESPAPAAPGIPAAPMEDPAESEAKRRAAAERQAALRQQEAELRLQQAEARASFRMNQSLAYIAIFALYVLLRFIF